MHPSIPATLLKEFALNYPAKTIPAGASLKSYSQHQDDCFYLETGCIRQSRLTGNGHEMTIHLYLEGSLFPLTNLFMANTENLKGLEAFCDSKVRIIPATALNNYISHHPELGYEFSRRLSIALKKMALRLGQSYYCDAQQRIISILLFLSQKFGQQVPKHPQKVMLQRAFTHEELSSFTGLSRETVSRELEKMEKEKLISLDYKKITLQRKDLLFNRIKKNDLVLDLFEMAS